MSLDLLLLVLFLIALLILIFAAVWIPVKKTITVPPMSDEQKQILEDRVPFYRNLSAGRKKEFEERALQFLAHIRITGVKTEVEELDRMLIAASAIIPIFNFPGWQYIQLHEVLLYPGAFDHEFRQEGENRHILGMVGNGPLNHVMILSRQQLREAFNEESEGSNTAMHEFIHLVDKTDGSIDGIPAFILKREYMLPWLELIHREIRLIRENRSEIDPYGSISQAEFFAVASEYFFNRPELLKTNHPELYAMLDMIFNPARQKK